MEDLKARLAEGNEFSPSLVGLTRDIAVERVEAAGFEVEVIPVTADAISASLAGNRIRLILDEDGTAVRV